MGRIEKILGARTKVWWFHGETETTREGITADLEAYKRGALQQSDNNACDILFDYQGGPDAGSCPPCPASITTTKSFPHKWLVHEGRKSSQRQMNMYNMYGLFSFISVIRCKCSRIL